MLCTVCSIVRARGRVRTAAFHFLQCVCMRAHASSARLIMPGDGDEVRASERREPGVRKFTWEELSKLNERHNAHIAVRGKVGLPLDGRMFYCLPLCSTKS